MFCAVCTSERPPFVTRPLGRKGALVRVCGSCDTEPARTKHGPERGYEPSGGLPSYAEAMRAVKLMDMPKAPRIRAAVYTRTPGYIIERVHIRGSDRVARDRQTIEHLAFRDKPWRTELRFLGDERGFFIWERPDADALAKIRAGDSDPLAGIQRYKRRT
jgi:hypothetical protein